jgi:hypothetical protein
MKGIPRLSARHSLIPATSILLLSRTDSTPITRFRLSYEPGYGHIRAGARLRGSTARRVDTSVSGDGRNQMMAALDARGVGGDRDRLGGDLVGFVELRVADEEDRHDRQDDQPNQHAEDDTDDSHDTTHA